MFDEPSSDDLPKGTIGSGAIAWSNSPGIRRTGLKAATNSPAPARRLHILVVDDDPVNQLLAARILQKAGHTAMVAENGQAALEKLAGKSFDLIVMDVEMPVMDGFEATSRIRQQEQRTGRHIPIVAVTAYAMSGDRERCLNAGMDAYVAKPIQLDEFLGTIDCVAAEHDRRGCFGIHGFKRLRTVWSGGPEETFELHAPAGQGAKPALARQSHLLESGRDLRRELAEVFLAGCLGRLAKIEEAIANRNGPELRIAAHALKGSAGVFHDRAAFAAAFQMELVGQHAEWENAAAAWNTLNQEIARLSTTLAELTGSDDPECARNFVASGC